MDDIEDRSEKDPRISGGTVTMTVRGNTSDHIPYDAAAKKVVQIYNELASMPVKGEPR